MRELLLSALPGVVLTLLSSVARSAEPLEIGHLETADDVGISWQYWSCMKTGETLRCDITQTLINHEIDPSQRDVELKKKLAAETPETFRREMADVCKNSEAMQKVINEKLAAGKRPDGSPFTRQEAADIRSNFAALAATCNNPTAENIRRMVEQQVGQSTRTCVVTNVHDQDTLHWNAVLKEWESRTPETGPCGSITETRLHRDESTAGFWLMEERHLFKRPKGVLFNGASCSALPADKTYHFTWRAAENAVECTYIKNSMN